MRGEPLPCPYANPPGSRHLMEPARSARDKDATYQWQVKTKWRLDCAWHREGKAWARGTGHLEALQRAGVILTDGLRTRRSTADHGYRRLMHRGMPLPRRSPSSAAACA